MYSTGRIHKDGASFLHPVAKHAQEVRHISQDTLIKYWLCVDGQLGYHVLHLPLSQPFFSYRERSETKYLLNSICVNQQYLTKPSTTLSR